MDSQLNDPEHCRRMVAEFRAKAAQADSVLLKMSYQALVREYEQRAARLAEKVTGLGQASFLAPLMASLSRR